MKVGEDLDVPTLTDVLVEYGFIRRISCTNPVQFCVRGGIIDIFSYGNDYPYRVELFDEEVESIRTFDPTGPIIGTERSAHVSIVPNINTRFSQEQKVSLFQVLPEDTVIWISDLQMTLDKLQTCFEKAEDFASTLTILDEGDLAEIFRDRAFIRPGEVVGDLEDHPLVFFTDHAQPTPVQQKISFAARPQPSFNKNFDLLIENLNENTRKSRSRIILFTDNPKQIERFYTIFEDLEAHVAVSSDHQSHPRGLH